MKNEDEDDLSNDDQPEDDQPNDSQNRLTIETPLEDVQFVVYSLDGFEGLSIPFEFQVRVSSESLDIDFSELIGNEITVSFNFKQEDITEDDEGDDDQEDEDDEGEEGEGEDEDDDDDDDEKPDPVRYFSGIVGKITQDQTYTDGDGNPYAYYQFVIHPAFWLLKFTKNYRIFQNLSASEIIGQILDENDVTFDDDQVSDAGQTVRDYCVQYDESDFDFVCRLMEEEGIFYFFQHAEDGHTLVLADTADDADSASGDAILFAANMTTYDPFNIVTEIKFQEQIVPMGYSAIDYNYDTPSTRLYQAIEGSGTGGVIYDYPALFSDTDEGESITDRRIAELEWPKTLILGKGTVPGFAPGMTFDLDNHPRDDINQEYLIYKVQHSIRQNIPPFDEGQDDDQVLEKIYENEFSAFPSDTEFRPPRITPKKRIYGNQTAIVTGPEGEEIHCDDQGRIKIQFPWDTRNGDDADDDSDNDDNDDDDDDDSGSSCWVRVAQSWAGAGWGSLVIPRVGMEVVVSFIDGDPDRPLVMGCVYNGDNDAPDYASDRPTASTFKTNSTEESDGYNEIRLDDESDNEEVYIHAQKDFTAEVENDLTLDVSNDMTVKVDGNREETISEDDSLIVEVGLKSTILSGPFTLNMLNIASGTDMTNILKGKKKTKIVYGDHVLDIGTGDDSTLIGKGDQTVTIVMGNQTITLTNGNINVTVNGEINFKSTGNISFESLGDISLKAMNVKTDALFAIEQTAVNEITQGANMINRQAKLMIQDSAKLSIKLKSDLEVKIEGGVNTTVKGGAMCIINGAMTKIN
ncbi:MAG: type VI secretion system tip protein TssI/VgrG [Alphaproteobacteria bacterium]|nr:type VI secretion system tip protein TssI/VgrG [Alphaproteobacteria bacterium]